MKVKKKKEFSYIIKDVDPNSNWELVGELGDGSFGKVYKAQHKTESSLSAAKIIIVNDENELEDFMVEIDILSECKHKNLVGLFETFLHDGKLWMMLEFCSGGALDDLMLELERGLNEPEIRAVTRQLFEGLQFLHNHKVIHRDLKAGNLLLASDGNVKMADFGVSAKNKKTLQKRSTFIGTPYWMAPEVVVTETYKDDPYDYKADIWSAGITLIELAQMVPPNHNMHPMRVLFKIPKSDPPTFDNPNKWSNDLNDFLASCVVKNPDMRASATEMIKHPFIADFTDNKALKDLYNEAKAEVIEEIEDLPEDTEENEEYPAPEPEEKGEKTEEASEEGKATEDEVKEKDEKKAEELEPSDKYSARLDNILDEMEDTGDQQKEREEEKETEEKQEEKVPEKEDKTEELDEEKKRQEENAKEATPERKPEPEMKPPQGKEFEIYLDDEPDLVEKLKAKKEQEDRLKAELAAIAAPIKVANGAPSVADNKASEDAKDGAEKKPEGEKHFKTLKRTRKFANQDGQIVTETTSRVVDVSGEDYKNALIKAQMQRKVNLRELKVLQRLEQKQGIELMTRIRRQWETQEQRFEQELLELERKYEIELDNLSRNQKRDIEKLELTQNADLRTSSRKMRQDQEKELKKFKENLKEEQKRSKKEVDKLPRNQRKDAWKKKKEELDLSHQQAEHEFQAMQQVEFEKFYKQMIDLHRQKMFEMEMHFLESKHERKRAHESEKWEIEFRHLNERHQLAKTQLKETFFLQRSQMLNRHLKEVEQHQHLTKLQEEDMKRRHEIERKRLPKIQRNEIKSKTQNYRKSLRVDKQMSLEDEKELMRTFEEAERKRAKSEYEKMLIRQDLEVEELRTTTESALKELQQLQNEKRHMLMESETLKLKERDDKHSSQMAAWKAELGPRKKRLEEEFAREKREQQLFY
ncbi:predicted protein, partial [Nematostella vectensis]